MQQPLNLPWQDLNTHRPPQARWRWPAQRHSRRRWAEWRQMEWCLAEASAGALYIALDSSFFTLSYYVANSLHAICWGATQGLQNIKFPQSIREQAIWMSFSLKWAPFSFVVVWDYLRCDLLPVNVYCNSALFFVISSCTVQCHKSPHQHGAIFMLIVTRSNRFITQFYSWKWQ